MSIYFWIFQADNHLELWEGQPDKYPIRADISRRVFSVAEGDLAAGKLSNSVIRIYRRISRKSESWCLRVFYEPHPKLKKDYPSFYHAPTEKDISAIRYFLTNENMPKQMAQFYGLGTT